MKAATAITTLVVTWAACSQALGDGAKIMRVTDAAAAVPGRTIISDYEGPLPPDNPRDEILQMPGWPVVIGGAGSFAPWRGVVFADLVGDPKLEIITSSTDSRIYAWDLTGAALPGFPVATIGMAQYPPSVADLDGDGDLEIVQFTRGLTSGGRLYILDHLGNVLPGFPISVNNNNLAAAPALHDLDGDGVLEIIVPERAWPIGYLHVFEIDGTEWGGNWPVALDHVPTGTAAVGDVDNDNALEIFYTSYTTMYLIELDGSVAPGWPQQLNDARFSYQSAVLADLDGDDDLEIVVGAHWNNAGCYIFHHDGQSAQGWPKLHGTWSYCPPTVTDLDNDGRLEILHGRAGVFGAPSNAFWAFSTQGTVKPGFPYVAANGGGSDGPITVADIDGDGILEIFSDNNVTVGGSGFLFGVDDRGNDLPDFPLRPRGFTYLNGATIADVDNDGDYELAVQSYHDNGVDVNLYDLTQTYVRSDRDWTIYHGRSVRGGLYPVVDFTPGDLNCDGRFDGGDIDPFFLALGDPPGYLAAFPGCDPLLGDMNSDGRLDGGDIDPFFACLGGGACP